MGDENECGKWLQFTTDKSVEHQSCRRITVGRNGGGGCRSAEIGIKMINIFLPISVAKGGQKTRKTTTAKGMGIMPTLNEIKCEE